MMLPLRMTIQSSPPSLLLWMVALGTFLALDNSSSWSSVVVSAAPLEDLVEHLPSYGRPPTPHFSGYLDASAGCDLKTNGPVCKLHYWLALSDEKVKHPKDAPVVLWLNGGPGSSSILGLLQEVGPLLINATGGLMDNPWGWTHVGVNLLVLEAPIGVGYSYCSRQVQGKVCKNTDTYTASSSRAALEDFFLVKFPEFRHNDFYITGESYAGVYIPTLSQQILEHSKIAKNLKAIAVGDPCTDNVAQADSMDPLWYSNKYGLMDEEIHDVLWNECDAWFQDRHAIRHKGFPPATASAVSSSSILQSLPHGPWANRALAALLNVELRTISNVEDRRLRAHELYQQHVLGMPLLADESLPLMGKAVKDDMTMDLDDDDTKCTIAYRKFLLSSSHALSQGWKDLYIDDYSLFAPVSSVEDQQMAAYMNRDDVKKALHVEETPIADWPYPHAGFDYTKEYNACNWMVPSDIKFPDTSMVDIYQDIVPQLDHTWIYNGDTDPCVSYEGTRKAVKQILVPELDGGGYRPWFYNQTAASMEVLAAKSTLFGPNLVLQDVGSQMGGHVVNYEEGLAFVTFHGSGHMVRYIDKLDETLRE